MSEKDVVTGIIVTPAQPTKTRLQPSTIDIRIPKPEDPHRSILVEIDVKNPGNFGQYITGMSEYLPVVSEGMDLEDFANAGIHLGDEVRVRVIDTPISTSGGPIEYQGRVYAWGGKKIISLKPPTSTRMTVQRLAPSSQDIISIPAEARPEPVKNPVSPLPSGNTNSPISFVGPLTDRQLEEAKKPV